MYNLEDIINNIHATPSDINEHIPTLVKYASECDHITEMGVVNKKYTDCGNTFREENYFSENFGSKFFKGKVFEPKFIYEQDALFYDFLSQFCFLRITKE